MSDVDWNDLDVRAWLRAIIYRASSPQNPTTDDEVTK